MLGVPLAWFPQLMAASPAEREAVDIGAFGLHWVRSARRTVRGTVRGGGSRRQGALGEDVAVRASAPDAATVRREELLGLDLDHKNDLTLVA